MTKTKNSALAGRRHTATKTYSAMLYALADEMSREEGCVTESPELVEQAATRLDDEYNALKRQKRALLAALNLIETGKDGDGFICREAMEQVREAIAQAGGAGK